jgi:DNA polymerase family A
MPIVTIDYETYYTREYSLSRMTTAEYILDPRFQTIMCSVAEGNNPPDVFIGHDMVAARFDKIDWSKTALLAHHTRFDGAIAAWHYGVKPAMYLDTLSMARATTHPTLGKSSLAAVSDYLGLPPKGTEVVAAMGMRLEDFRPAELDAYASYCKRDNTNCRMIFDRLRPVFCGTELQLIDLIIRMYALPQVKLNPGVLTQYLAQIKAEKEAALARISHIGKDVLASNPQFAALLESYGVQVPVKLSPTTGKPTYALARNDRAFKELCEDDTQPIEVQAILSARLSTKSTIEETRTQKLLDQSLSVVPLHAQAVHGPGAAPIPLKYYGAKSGRLSGDDGTNWQNFKRASLIREAVEAPPGMRIVHRDASQIEARMVAWLAGCKHLVEAFRAGRDVYSEFASTVYSRMITKADTKERFVGKTGILGLGYGCGAPKFRHMLFIGNGGVSVQVTEEEALRIVRHYRSAYPEIPELWKRGGNLLTQIMAISRPIKPGLGVKLRQSIVAAQVGSLEHSWVRAVTPGHDSIWFPNGLCIAYPNIRQERTPTNDIELVYDGPNKQRYRIYGPKAIENISQALSRIVVTDIAVRIFHLTKIHPFLSTHDSLDYCVPVGDVQWWDEVLEEEFAKVPDWAEGLPLASEGGFGRTLMRAEKKENQ